LGTYPWESEFLINPHTPACIIDEGAYGTHDTVLIVVTSAKGNFQQRQTIRNSWGSVKSSPGTPLVIRFFIGRDPGGLAQLNSAVSREAREYGDIIQQDFVDSYRNLTLKSLGVLRWASLHCPRAAHLLKVDDDTFVVPTRVIAYVTRKGMSDVLGGSKRIFCTLRSRAILVKRNQRSKWYTSKEQWPNRTFPPFCHGFGYMLPRAAFSELLLAAVMHVLQTHAEPVNVEDAFVTGVLAERAGWRRDGPGPFVPALKGLPITEDCQWSEGPLVVLIDKSTIIGKDEQQTRYERAFFALHCPSLLMVAHVKSEAHMRSLHANVQGFVSQENQVSVADKMKHGVDRRWLPDD
jgi:hypothetical protein